MAKKMTRYGSIAVALAFVGVLTVLPWARSQPQPGGPDIDAPIPLDGNPQFAGLLREAVGCGSRDVLPAMVNNLQHEQIAAAAMAFTDGPNLGLRALVRQYRAAQRQLRHALTWGENPEAAYQQLAAARNALAGQRDRRAMNGEAGTTASCESC
ncbi:MAG: hypothetical protein ACE5F9_00375 [Phycisphaerae bacterium]